MRKFDICWYFPSVLHFYFAISKLAPNDLIVFIKFGEDVFTVSKLLILALIPVIKDNIAEHVTRSDDKI